MAVIDSVSPQTDEVSEYYARARSLDLDWMQAHWPDQHRRDPEAQTHLLNRYRKWLALRGAYGPAAVPVPADLDQVWHTHILNTRRYAADCEALFGHFLHHTPRGSGSSSQAGRGAMGYIDVLWQRHYGESVGVSRLAECD